MSSHEETCRLRIQRLERRLAALQDLGVGVGGLQSQVSFARDLVSEGRFEDAVQLSDELLGLAEGMAKGHTTGNRAAVQAKTSSERFYMREHTVDQVQAVLEGGMLERFMREHLGAASDHPELLDAFRSGLRRAVAAIAPEPESQQRLTDRIQAAVTARVGQLRDEVAAEISTLKTGLGANLSQDLDSLAQQVTEDLGGAGSAVESEMTRRVRRSLGDRVGAIEDRLSSQLSAMEQRMGDLGRMLDLVTRPEPPEPNEPSEVVASPQVSNLTEAAVDPSSESEFESDVAELLSNAAGEVETGSVVRDEATRRVTAAFEATDDDPESLAKAVAEALGIGTDRIAAADNEPEEAVEQVPAEATPEASDATDDAAAAMDQAAMDQAAIDRLIAGDALEAEMATATSPQDDVDAAMAAALADAGAIESSAPASPQDDVDAAMAAALADAGAIESSAPASPQDEVDAAMAAAMADGTPASPQDEVDQVMAAALAEEQASIAASSPQDIVDQAMAETAGVAEEPQDAVDQALAAAMAAELTGRLDDPETTQQVASDALDESGAAKVVAALEDVHGVGSTLQAMVDAVLDEAHAELATSGDEHSPTEERVKPQRDSGLEMAPGDSESGDSSSEESFLRAVSEMLHSGETFTPAKPPSPEPEAVAPSPAPTAAVEHDVDGVAPTLRMAEGGMSLDPAALKQTLIELLPELLRDDSIKQALFAVLATEVAVNPGVLGDLTGLREFLAREVRFATEQQPS